MVHPLDMPKRRTSVWRLVATKVGTVGTCIGSDAIHNLHGVSELQNNRAEINLSKSLDRPV
jgi:hypothetical protein